MIEKYGTDALLCNCCSKAKLELIYVVDINAEKKCKENRERLIG
jgi:hypothetical protein